MGSTGKALYYDETEHFGKTFHLLWDLALIQRFLPERQDVLVLIGMLRYADFESGVCTVFVTTLAHRAGIKHPTQVRRIQQKIVEMGAFWRPKGRKGFMKVNGKWAPVFVRSTGKRILAHALEKNLITEEKYLEMEEEQLQRDLEREAEEAMSGEPDGRDMDRSDACDDADTGVVGVDEQEAACPAQRRA